MRTELRKNIGSRFWARLQNFRIEGKRKRKLLQGLGLYRDNGKENGNYRDYRGYIGIIGYSILGYVGVI